MLSDRIIHTQAPPLVELGQLASSLPDCISLGQGAPYYSPPDYIIKDLQNCLTNTDIHRYTPDPGLQSLRQSVSQKLAQDQNIVSKPDQIIITPGANQAFYNVIVTIADPADEIILLSPYYFNHYMACQSLNVNPVTVPLNSDFSFNITNIRRSITDRTRAIVLVNPGNPTGVVHDRADVKALIELAQEYDLVIIADETYEYFTYSSTTHYPVASFDYDMVVSISSFSKTFGIPGWRLGYYLGPTELIAASIKIQDTTGICAANPSQVLGGILLKERHELIPPVVDLMEVNQSLAVDLLEEVSWLEATPSNGAYYLFPRQTTDQLTLKLVRELITDYGVYVVPGSGFGSDWEKYCRISFANVDEEMLKEAFARLKSYS